MQQPAAPLSEKERLASQGFELPGSYPAQPKRTWRKRVVLALSSLGLILGVFLFTSVWRHRSYTPQTRSTWSVKRADSGPSATVTATSATASPTVLEVFMVDTPVLSPAGPTTDKALGPSTADGAVTVTIMEHVFGNSYGQPFIGSYKPPLTPFNRVLMNFTVVSEGRQYDRLAVMYLNDTEVWRTSTAEPSQPPGIRWEYLKDMTAYLALWRQPQTVVFDLGNLVSSTRNGEYNTTLSLTFWQSDVVAPGGKGAAPPSDVIIPITKRNSNGDGAGMFSLPSDMANNTITNFPRNARRAVFSVSANGQSAEEFWWSNVLQSDTNTFDAEGNEMYGASPFREVQVLIDGQLAGVQWPFPVVYSGGIVPGLHHPILGIDVFNLREHEIDISPWLPVLCDGKPHTFSMHVYGLDDDGRPAGTATLTEAIGASWYVTGKIFVWLDEEEVNGAPSITTGEPPIVKDGGVDVRITQRVHQTAGTNDTLTFTVSVVREFSVQGHVTSGGASRAVQWTQSLQYSNEGVTSGFGDYQINTIMTQGSDHASGQSIGSPSPGPDAHAYEYFAEYQYPFTCNTTYDVSAQGNVSLWANLDQGMSLMVSGAGVFPTGLEAFSGLESGSSAIASKMETRNHGEAWYYATGDNKHAYSWGTVGQNMTFGAFSAKAAPGGTPDVPLYSREVKAVNSTVIYDNEVVA
ncbi:hypothetical protein SEPCBS57363_003486 [Sporothrix epigloea]|uniref:Peptide N-acetyl-beta-D-glucosaminyl asparaginase amidase A N-terminal domain-containing protein n=1 Tax=Sporothrix epigloea TaxID=1892477 RepID=A0ABP0DLT0_9PEZI